MGRPQRCGGADPGVACFDLISSSSVHDRVATRVLVGLVLVVAAGRGALDGGAQQVDDGEVVLAGHVLPHGLNGTGAGASQRQTRGGPLGAGES